jgi:rare lipoprotein A (peptidoglycan hydrolase)
VSRRAIAVVAISLALSAAELSLPAAGIAYSGGGGLAPGASSNTTNSPSAQAQPGNGKVSASGNGMTIVTAASAFLSNQVTFTGSAPRSDSGATVEIERSGHETGWQWAPTASATVGRDGSFSAVWRANHIGRFAIRAVISASSPRGATSSPTLTVTIYRPSVATLYGPGFWGHRTACGLVLRRTTLGVANRTLKCGTPVAIYYHGRTITVPVIDRGPYAHGADWDLTMATARALRVSGTATIGAVSLPSRH